jgi:ribosome maturation factor RimP
MDEMTSVKPFVEQFLVREGYQLVDLVIHGKPGSLSIQCFVDRPGGITVGECVKLSHSLSDSLFSLAGDPGGDQIRLEVSSPGVDRPLRTSEDFRRNIGREVAIDCTEGEEHVRRIGTIGNCTEQSVELMSDNQAVLVPFASIRQAKIQIHWR